ncbi:hypothetical protein NIES593_22940 [Hydrococcus rivularis NIES-593]|uniref:CsbD-like domain-containing protein n=1 Tax=Hydrococcus rivularis NIES-593 TaxID=1921803 RepID=A0A1U7H6U1_9CYAN|nr:hypothetical protein [Hydrococcus rivularis]OKH17638.1 hypothetical protein NIES593_22940 [Hydrococcus rivularis NIES-593]
MKNNFIVNNLWKNGRKLLLAFSCLLALAFGWQGSFIFANNFANATALESNYRSLADLGSSGLKNQVEGRAQQELGKTQSAIDEAGKKVEKAAKRTARQADATAKQIKGRAQQNIGKTQSELQKAENRVEDTTENVMNKVKSFFGQ